jgi:hypothetical protein
VKPPGADRRARRASCQIPRDFSLMAGKKIIDGATGQDDR